MSSLESFLTPWTCISSSISEIFNFALVVIPFFQEKSHQPESVKR